MSDETQPVTLVDLLDQLIQPDEPAAISMIPQTAGWIVLAVIAVAALGWGIWGWLRHHRANAYRRAALAELKQVGDDPVAIAAILRRTALAAYPRTSVASLSGAAWLAFLDATGGGDTFRSGAGQPLAQAPYHPVGPSSALSQAAVQWVRRHDTDAQP